MKRSQNTPVEVSNPLERAALIAGERAMQRLKEQALSSAKAGWDPNAPESEEDGLRAEALRRLKVRQLSKGRQGQTQD